MIQADWSHLTSNVFFAASTGLASVGWLVAFAGACSASQLFSLPLLWFVIFFNLFLIIGFVAAVITKSLPSYRFVLLAFTASNIVLLCFHINESLARAVAFSPRRDAFNAITAGLIILNMVMFSWVFALGSEKGSLLHRYTTDLSLPTHNNGAPQPNFAGGNNGNQIQGSNVSMQQNMMSPGGAASPIPEYTLKAEALYAYTASPEDPNELSFAQGEILEIADNKGKWWQAKNSNGTVGIAPSNYLKLI